MKQLNFKHFNINSKKFTVTVNFSQKDTKTAPKGQYYFVWYTKKFSVILRRFPIILEDFLRLPKIPEDCRRFPKMSAYYRRFPRRNPKIFDYISSLYSHVKDIFLQCKDTIFSVREILVIHSNLYNNRILFIIKIGYNAKKK